MIFLRDMELLDQNKIFLQSGFLEAEKNLKKNFFFPFLYLTMHD